MKRLQWYMMRSNGERVPVNREAVILNLGGSAAARLDVAMAESVQRSNPTAARPIVCRGVRYEVVHA